jgi:hypothetical protein
MNSGGTRWHYRDPLLVWLLVAAYALHIVEEYVGGFPEWFAYLAGAPLGRGEFLVLNAVGLGAMAAAARAATREESLGWLAIGIAAILLLNGVAHLTASLVTGTYSPGLFTGVILYLPLGQLALLRAWLQAPREFFWRGVAVGVAAHLVVTLTAGTLAWT